MSQRCPALGFNGIDEFYTVSIHICMIRDPEWHLYRAFLAVLRQGSLSGAARVLNLTQPTLGRQIAELEAAIAQPLFTRAQGGMTPTPIALTLQPLAEAMASAAAAIGRVAAGDGAVRGTVRIAASDVVGTEVLPPMLAAIRTLHPNLVFELALSNRADNLLRRDADIAVRMFRPQQDAILARRLGTVEIGLFALRDYLARFGMPTNLADLARFHIVGFDRDDSTARGIQSTALRIDRSTFSFRSDNDHAQLAAIRAGLGIGGIQRRIAARWPELCPVLPTEINFPLEVWLAMHEDQRALPPVRLVYDALAHHLLAWLG